MAIQPRKTLLNRKEFQMMSPAPASTAAGAFIVKDPLGTMRSALYVTSNTTQYLYDVDNDGWQQLPSFALAGTFGAGACGTWLPWSDTISITVGGDGSTVSTLSSVSGLNLVGRTVWITSGTNNQQRSKITSFIQRPYASSSFSYFKVDPPFTNTGTFNAQLDTGVYYVLGAGTVASGIFKKYDVLRGTVTTLSTSGLPATWGTDGKLIGFPAYADMTIYTGSVTNGYFTRDRFYDSSKIGPEIATFGGLGQNFSLFPYRLRWTSGTNIGTYHYIYSIDEATGLIQLQANMINFAAQGETYVIEPCNNIILLGNNSTTQYVYVVTNDSWYADTMNIARGAAPGAGMTANWIPPFENEFYTSSSLSINPLQGRYIYSLRGGGSAVMDRFDSMTRSWYQLTVPRSQETFTTGTSADVEDGKIYLTKESTGRFFVFDIIKGDLVGLTTDFYPQSTAVVGDKSFTVEYVNSSGDNFRYLYYLGNTSNVLRRVTIPQDQ